MYERNRQSEETRNPENLEEYAPKNRIKATIYDTEPAANLDKCSKENLINPNDNIAEKDNETKKVNT